MSELSSKGKIIYASIGLRGMTQETASRYKIEATPTVEYLLRRFTLYRPDGNKVGVTVTVDDRLDETDAFRGAWAGPVSPGVYKISIGAGLIAQLAAIARSIAADKTKLRGRTRTRLLSNSVRADGREKALGDFAFHFMLMFIVWHEVAHISLGHIDWRKDRTGFGVIDEYTFEPLPKTDLTRRQAMEADADRQAAMWSAAYIDDAIENNPYLRYATKADSFYDIGFIYGALFGLLDARDSHKVPPEKRKHPKANIRLGIALAFVASYIEKIYPDSAARLHEKVVAGGVNALATMFHSEKRAFNPFEIYAFMMETGRLIEELGIRSFAHKVTLDDAGSFAIQL